MEFYNIAYKDTNSFSELLIDYLNQDKKLNPFVNHFPSLENFEKQIIEKKRHIINREVLIEVLKEQNSNLYLSDSSQNNISLLESKETFTVTTGHQLCLFTGPLYCIYKIISAINLTEQLKEKYPKNNFVPVFWMASEDHDFQEINHISLFGKRLVWDSEQNGSVGRMNLQGIEKLIEELKGLLGETLNAKKLTLLFENSYLKNNNLSDATRYLFNELFGKYGLVIIDADDKKLKEQFIPIMKRDILENKFFDSIKKCSDSLAKDSKPQALVRDINFFKLSAGKRELIKGEVTEKEIKEDPKSFSPNVLLRPFYQESILPNIAYVGGGSEIAYWMQLKTAFEQEEIPFPILILRSSALLINKNQKIRFENFGFKIEDFFLSEDKLKKKYVLLTSKSDVSLESEKIDLENLYNRISDKASDIGLKNSISSQLRKHINNLNDLQQKLIREEKKKYKTSLNQIAKIKAQLFPNNRLQERHDNFIPFYLKDGENFLEIIKSNFDPLSPNFVVLFF